MSEVTLSRRTHLLNGARDFILVIVAIAALCRTSTAVAATVPELWAERLKSVVAVEYLTETEADRRPTVSMGTVIDTQGTVILPANAVDPRAATWQLKDLKIHLPGDAGSTPAQYLGQDAYTGWHFVRVAESLRSR